MFIRHHQSLSRSRPTKHSTMAFKFIVFAAFVAVANAGVLPAVAPVAYTSAIIAPVGETIVAKTIDYDAHPQYSYGYDVHDSLTGDIKNQHETRDGDVVKGSYSLIESDGTRRTVDYSADSLNGFNAVVHKEPATLAVKTVAAAPVALKTIAAAPVAVKTIAAAPIVHAAPLAYTTSLSHTSSYSYRAPATKLVAAPVAYAAPVAKLAAPVAVASTYSYATPVVKYAVAPLVNHYSYAAPHTTYVH